MIRVISACLSWPGHTSSLRDGLRSCPRARHSCIPRSRLSRTPKQQWTYVAPTQMRLDGGQPSLPQTRVGRQLCPRHSLCSLVNALQSAGRFLISANPTPETHSAIPPSSSQALRFLPNFCTCHNITHQSQGRACRCFALPIHGRWPGAAAAGFYNQPPEPYA